MEYQPKLILSVPQAAVEVHANPSTLWTLARRKEDPFPIRIRDGNTRNGFVIVSEMMPWVERNSELIGGHDGNGR